MENTRILNTIIWKKKKSNGRHYKLINWQESLTWNSCNRWTQLGCKCRWVTRWLSMFGLLINGHSGGCQDIVVMETRQTCSIPSLSAQTLQSVPCQSFSKENTMWTLKPLVYYELNHEWAICWDILCHRIKCEKSVQLVVTTGLFQTFNHKSIQTTHWPSR